MHEGHRRRLLQKLKNGDNLFEHELLEILLFNAYPRKNVNPVAHALLSRFAGIGEILQASPDELTTVEGVGENVALYKEIRPLVQFGDLYRLADADEDEFLCTQYVNENKTESVVFLAARGTRFYKKRVILRFAGLDPVRRYRLEFDGKMIEKSGAYLMEAGLAAHIRGADYNTVLRLFAV